MFFFSAVLNLNRYLNLISFDTGDTAFTVAFSPIILYNGKTYGKYNYFGGFYEIKQQMGK